MGYTPEKEEIEQMGLKQRKMKKVLHQDKREAAHAT